MAGIMQSMKVKNKPSRNPFDMSENVAFTACLGAYLPITHMHLNPGDKVKDTLRFFSRTAPVRTAAYGRIRETFDWFFVPYRLIWRAYDGFFTDGSLRLNDNNNTSYHSDASTVPFFTPEDAGDVIINTYSTILQLYKKWETGSSSIVPNPNIPGLSFYDACRAQDMQRLLHFLGYGKIVDLNYDAEYTDASLNYAKLGRRDNIPLNALPLLAYHKIYYDFYRNTQWENNQPHMYWFNNTDADSDIGLETPTGSYINQPHIFDLHYCNYEQDKYLGVLPNSQLGIPAVVNTANSLVGSGVSGRAIGVSGSVPGIGITTSSVGSSGTTTLQSLGDDPLSSAFNFNILALRQSQALQKWKEISQFFPMEYKHQVSAHYGFNVDDGRSNLVHYLDGCSSLVEINSVLNQNLAESDSEASIQGKGDNVGTCNIDFTAPEHGILMCIYHANPLVDYNGDNTMIPENRKYFNTDFPIPEFDSIGLESVLNTDMDVTCKWAQSYNFIGAVLGYAPRYIDFKTRIDRVLGDFTKSRDGWVCPLPQRVIDGVIPLFGIGSEISQSLVQHYCRFKVSPRDADSLFFMNPGHKNEFDTDYLLVDASFQRTKVSNLNRSGMPY